MTKKIFVIEKMGYEYNDEYYQMLDYGSSYQAFTSRASAEESVRRNTRVFFRNMGRPNDWANDCSDITGLNVEEFTEKVNAILGAHFDDAWNELNLSRVRATGEQIDAIAKVFQHLVPYTIREVELDN